jgi:hypothetical protein
MTQQRRKKEISLGEDFDDVVVKVNGATINVSAAGYVIAGSPSELSIGAVMKDGTIYAGISPDTNKPMYATPADAPLTMKFNEAQKYAAKLDAHHHRDWRVPTKAELNVLFNNRAAIGGFNLTGSDPAGWYWSASSDSRWGAWDQRFSDGYQRDNGKGVYSSVRCVR